MTLQTTHIQCANTVEYGAIVGIGLYANDPSNQCFVSKRLAFKTAAVIRLIASARPSVKLHLCISWHPEAAAPGFADAGVAFGERTKAAPHDWILVDSCLCAVRLIGSCKVDSRCCGRRNLFIVSAYAPKDCSSEAMKDTFYQKLHDLLCTTGRRDMNA